MECADRLECGFSHALSAARDRSKDGEQQLRLPGLDIPYSSFSSHMLLNVTLCLAGVGSVQPLFAKWVKKGKGRVLLGGSLSSIATQGFRVALTWVTLQQDGE